MNNMYHRYADRTGVHESGGRKRMGSADAHPWHTRRRLQCALRSAILTLPIALSFGYFAVLQYRDCQNLLNEHNWKPVKVIVRDAKVECDDDGYRSLYVDFIAPDNGLASEELVTNLTNEEAKRFVRCFKKGTYTKAYQNDKASSRKVAIRPATVINRASLIFWLLLGGALGTMGIGGALWLHMVDSIGDSEGLRLCLKRLRRQGRGESEFALGTVRQRPGSESH